jgi:beta-glucosidase
LGFEGFLISDYAAINQLPGTYKQQVQMSINAGMDMVMIPEKYVLFINTLKELATEGGVPVSRIDDAVTRILRAKFAMGLMDTSRSPLADRSLHKSFGSAEHRAAAQECVRASVVLLKNDNRLLPLRNDGTPIHVAGPCADDIGIQCGGWTIKWQGQSGKVTNGTTILAAIRNAAPSAQVSYSPDGSGVQGPGVGIAVIGEMPYAEGSGDRRDLHLAPSHVAVVNNLKNAGLRVLVIVISGRPLFLEPILDQADAIVAAWLPGSEGAGVADVLFGAYKPSGKLSFTWPRAASTTLHLGDAGYQKLFNFGYGLSY